MPDGHPYGPKLPDNENVYRAILTPTWWVESENRPSSAAFDHAVFSVDVKSKTTPALTASRFQATSILAEFQCGEARVIGFDPRDELDPEQPNNLAHAHIYLPDYDTLPNKKRKTMARNLANKCEVVRVEL